MDRHALLGEGLVREGGDLLVLDGQDARQHLDDRHLGAEVRIEAGELDPDRARADHQQLGRHLLRHQRVPVGPDPLPVRLGEGQVPRPRAGRDQDGLGGKLGLRAILGDGQLALAGDRPVALDDRDLVLLHQPLHAHVELPRDLAAPLHHRGEVEGRLLRAQPVGRGVGHIMIDFRGPKQRLGRNAPPVEADPAQLLPLDDRHLHPELRRPDRRDIAAGAGAEDDEVVSVSHVRLQAPDMPPGGQPPDGAANASRRGADPRIGIEFQDRAPRVSPVSTGSRVTIAPPARKPAQRVGVRRLEPIARQQPGERQADQEPRQWRDHDGRESQRP